MILHGKLRKSRSNRTSNSKKMPELMRPLKGRLEQRRFESKEYNNCSRNLKQQRIARRRACDAESGTTRRKSNPQTRTLSGANNEVGDGAGTANRRSAVAVDDGKSMTGQGWRDRSDARRCGCASRRRSEPEIHRPRIDVSDTNCRGLWPPTSSPAT